MQAKALPQQRTKGNRISIGALHVFNRNNEIVALLLLIILSSANTWMFSYTVLSSRMQFTSFAKLLAQQSHYILAAQLIPGRQIALSVELLQQSKIRLIAFQLFQFPDRCIARGPDTQAKAQQTANRMVNIDFVVTGKTKHKVSVVNDVMHFQSVSNIS